MACWELELTGKVLRDERFADQSFGYLQFGANTVNRDEEMTFHTSCGSWLYCKVTGEIQNRNCTHVPITGRNVRRASISPPCPSDIFPLSCYF